MHTPCLHAVRPALALRGRAIQTTARNAWEQGRGRRMVFRLPESVEWGGWLLYAVGVRGCVSETSQLNLGRADYPAQR